MMSSKFSDALQIYFTSKVFIQKYIQLFQFKDGLQKKKERWKDRKKDKTVSTLRVFDLY